MPLQFRGAMTPVLNWLESLPTTSDPGQPLVYQKGKVVITVDQNNHT
jgi:hypothetical protein